MNNYHSRAIFPSLLKFGWIVLVLICSGQSANSQVTAEYCGPLTRPPAAAPWDYNVDKQFIRLVEDAHFTTQVEQLIRGQSTFRAGPDLDYTLYRFPNHPRALIAVTRAAQQKTEAKIYLPRPAECYFERALRFRKDDRVVRMLYAKFLYGQNRKGEAIHQLRVTSESAGDNPLSHRNIGLIYLEMKENALALEQWQVLKRLEYEDPVLRDALMRAGAWQELPAAVDSIPSGTAAPAASATSK